MARHAAKNTSPRAGAEPSQELPQMLGRPGPAFPLDAVAWQHVVKTLELSPQQARIVSLILHGLRDKEVAGELGLGVPTIRTYLDRVFQRVGARDRVELVIRVFVVARGAGRTCDCRQS
jgi:DNA-binding NarL/FixJ family response regulator